jgi:hypothetical protein
MDSERKVSLVFNTNPQGSRLKGRQNKEDSGTVYKEILRGAKLKTGKRGKKKLNRRSPLRRRSSTLDCNAI